MAKRKQDAIALNSINKKSYASASAIANMVEYIRRHGMPQASSRPTQYRARKEICNKMTPYGTIVQKVSVPLAKGGDAMVSMQAPLPYFYHNCEQSITYARIVREALRRKPSTAAEPWNIIIYQDGVDPSDMGAEHHTRSACAWYWSFAELGIYALGHEEMWGCICTLRKSEYNQFTGAIAGLFASLLGLFRGTHDIQLAGVTVVIDGEPVTILARVGVIFGDEPALKEMLDCKGHAGIKPCLLCKNIVLRSSMDLYSFPPPMKTIACFNWNQLLLHNDDSIKATIKRVAHWAKELQAKRITHKEFGDRAGILGWNNNPAHDILFGDKFNLQVASSVMYDWPHIYVHGGLADVEMGLLMKKLAKRRSSCIRYTEARHDIYSEPIYIYIYKRFAGASHTDIL